MNPARRLIMGMASGFGSVALRSALNFLVIPIIIGMLGLTQYGVYVLLIGILDIVLMMDFGFTYGLTQMLTTYRSQENTTNIQHLLFLGHRMYLLISLLVMIIGFSSLTWFPQLFGAKAGATEIFQFGLLIVVLEAVLTLYECFYNAILISNARYDWININNTLTFVVGTLLGMGSLFMGYGLAGFLVARLIFCAIRVLVAVFQALHQEPQLFSIVFSKDLKFEFAEAKLIFNRSMHAMIRHLSDTLSWSIDRYVVAFFLPVASVGILDIVVRLSGMALQICRKMSESSFPLFTRLAALKQFDEARTYLLRISALNNFIVALLLLMVFQYYPILFNMLSSDKVDIHQTWILLAVAMPVAWSSAIGMVLQSYLYSFERHKFLSIAILSGAIFNVILSVILIQILGLPGVLLGTLIPLVLLNQLIFFAAVAKELHLSVWVYFRDVILKSVPALALAGTLSSLLAYGFTPYLQPLAVAAVSGGLACSLGFLVWLAFALEPQEKQRVLETLSRFLPQPKVKELS